MGVPSDPVKIGILAIRAALEEATRVLRITDGVLRSEQERDAHGKKRADHEQRHHAARDPGAELRRPRRHS